MIENEATRCVFIARVIREDTPVHLITLNWDKVQCANEKGHVGGHLIVVEEN